MNNLLSLKKGPINPSTGQKLKSQFATPISENSVINNAVNNIVNARKQTTPQAGGASPSPTTMTRGTSRAPFPAVYNGNGIIGSYMQNNGLPGGTNPFIKKAQDTYGNAIRQAVQAAKLKPTQAGGASPSPTAQGEGIVKPAQKNPEIVRVRDYVAPYTQYPLNYDNDLGKVFLAGREVPIAYISEDGRSYAKKTDLDAILNQLRYSDPYSKDAIIQRVIDSGNDITNAVNSLKTRKEFSYDYRNDPVYQAYSRYYDELRDDAIREAISANVARTGGFMNSNALSAAHQAAAEYDKLKATLIPTLEAQAYERFANERQLDNDAALAIGNMVNSYMNNMTSLYGHQDNRDLEKYTYDNELVQNSITNDRNYELMLKDKEFAREQFEKEYALELRNMDLAERAQAFNEWYQSEVLGKKYNQSVKSTPSRNPGSNNSNAGTWAPIS